MTILAERRARLFTGTPSRSLRYLPASTLVVDAGLVTSAGMLAALGRDRLPVFREGPSVSGYLDLVGPLIMLGWVLTLGAFGAYRTSVFGAGTDEYKRVFNASIFAAGLVGIVCYLAKYQLSRGFFLLLFCIGIPALMLGRVAVRRALHEARRRGLLLHRVLIAGSPAHIDEVAAVLRRESWLGYRVVGALTAAHHLDEETAGGIPVIGNTDDVTAVVRDSKADVVFFAGGALASGKQMRNIAWELEHDDVQVVMAPSVSDVSSERVKIRPVGGLPLVHIDPPRATDASRWGKRLFDITASASLLVLASPLMLFAALRVKLHDRGPVFFGHTRIGKDGEEFRCLKFRTMVVDAEARIRQLQAELGETALLFKMKDDPRITTPGRWMRRLSVDELPQLLNVLKGDMSLVGPRPQVAAEVALYDSAMRRRLRVRPGITGLWQVSGRSDLSLQEAIRLDLFYVDNWSMLQDISILLKTVSAVFGSKGAY